MESKVFNIGNYIWECKSSHSDPGGAIDPKYLERAIALLQSRWENRRTPSGYYYVFPVNLINNDGRRILEEFKYSYTEIDINYYDRDNFQGLIQELEKLSDFESLVNYLKSI
ncbi:hypothetical protein [Chamaesiphon sp.]|uniref:hypothetical protein n=1 Tax=Chamaesiphon sp. TaxID=2814140 RepID=UPI003593DE6C